VQPPYSFSGNHCLKLCAEGEYSVDSTSKVYLCLLLALAYERRDEKSFGNGRYVRNLFEQATVRSSQRLVSQRAIIGKAHLMRVDPSDLMVGPLAGTDPNAIRLDALKWRACCPQCQAGHVGVQIHQWREVKCRRCGTKFVFEPFNPLLDSMAW
jgi:AAA lid domain